MNENPLRILLVYPEFPDTFWSFKHALEICPEEGRCASAGLTHRCSDVAFWMG